MSLLLVLCLLTTALSDDLSTPDQVVLVPADTVVVQEPIMERDVPRDGILPRPAAGTIALTNYPATARRDRVQGTVRVGFTVTETGDVRDVEVVRSVREDLDRAAVEAVQTTVFEPGQIAGEAVSVRMTVPIRFRLSRDQRSPHFSLPYPCNRPDC